MSYCTLEEAFQTSISDAVLPPTRQQNEEPSSGGEKGRSKSKRSKRSNLPPQEPSVIEPDRPAHRPKPAAELLGAPTPPNDTSTSISSYLIGAGDPGEDYFPYPNGAENEPGFDKSFMLEPNWYEQFQDRMPSPRSETPPLPGAGVDGYHTLYQRVPPPQSRSGSNSNSSTILPTYPPAPPPGNPTTIAGAAVNESAGSDGGSSSNDSTLRKRIDEIFQKLDTLEISRSESNHSEIILFVMTGIFVLLMLDLLLKQGCRAISTIASASAIPQAALRGGYAVDNPFFF